jgi:hypothetical protein
MNTITKKSYLNAVLKIRKLGFVEPATSEIRQNPYSGVSCELSPLAVMIYDFVTTTKFVCGKDYARQTWDNARYCFMEQWPDEYYKLID